MANFEVAVYTGSHHLYSRREQWPLVAGSRATLLDVWKVVAANRRAEQAEETGHSGEEPYELVDGSSSSTVDSIDGKAHAKAIDWTHFQPSDAAEPVLRQFAYLKFSVTLHSPPSILDSIGSSAGSAGLGSPYQSLVDAGAEAGDEEEGGDSSSNSSTRQRPVYRGVLSRRPVWAVASMRRALWEEASVEPATPFAPGKARYALFVVMSLSIVILFGYCFKGNHRSCSRGCSLSECVCLLLPHI